jgi:hypothetical protein
MFTHVLEVLVALNEFKEGPSSLIRVQKHSSPKKKLLSSSALHTVEHNWIDGWDMKKIQVHVLGHTQAL